MDIVSVLNLMDPDLSEAFFQLEPDERELVYTRGISLTILENEFNKKGRQDDLIFLIKGDPDLYNINNINVPKVILKAAKNKILEMKSVDEVRAYLEYLDILRDLDYTIYDANNIKSVATI
jgi:hypothetical protein